MPCSRYATALLILVLAAGCRSSDPLGPRASVFDDSDTPIRTGSAVYTLRSEAGGLAAVIDIEFRNPTSERFYIVNCNGGLAVDLQKLQGSEWVSHWQPVLPMCLSHPIVIEPGATLSRSVPVWGALPGGNSFPQWTSAEIAGTYRLVLTHVVRNYADGRQGFGDPVPLEQRVSNRFELRRNGN